MNVKKISNKLTNFFYPKKTLISTKARPPHLKKIAYILQLLTLFSYALTARWVFYFERKNIVILILIALAILCEIIFLKINMKDKFNIKKFRPYSAAITGISCSLLIDSSYTMPYLIAVICAVSSKYIFKYKNNHYFNPANFGVVLVLLFFYKDINLAQNIFASEIYIAMTFFVLGLIIAFLASQLKTAIFWLVGFAFFTIIRSKFSIDVFFDEILIMFSSSFLLFSFYMITDPATTPKSTKGNLLFSSTVAFIDCILRIAFIPNGMFYALLITSSCLPIITKPQKQIWHYEK